MANDPAEMRQKADACRMLANIAENPERKALWLNRADYWEELAVKAVKVSGRSD
jgi:hypothetical protein